MSSLSKLALQNNKEEIVLLLQQGADVNEQDANGFTALYFACHLNYTKLAEFLLQNKKINVNLQNKDGWSPFSSSACLNDRCAIIHFLLQDARVDTNLANYCGCSPLMQACYYGRTKTIQLLLSYGRNIDVHKKSTKDNGDIISGSTALDIAKRRNITYIVQLLQQYINNTKETQKTLRNQLLKNT